MNDFPVKSIAEVIWHNFVTTLPFALGAILISLAVVMVITVRELRQEKALRLQTEQERARADESRRLAEEEKARAEHERRLAEEKAQRAYEAVDSEEADRAQQHRDAQDFARNLKSTIVLQQLVAKQLPWLGDCSWTLQPGMNVLLGRNGYGKSLLLRALAASLTRSKFEPITGGSSDSQLTIALRCDGESKHIVRGATRFVETIGPVPLLAIPDSRFVNRAEDALRPSPDAFAELARQGARHFIQQLPYHGMVQGLLYGLCLDYERHQSFQLPGFALLTQVFSGLTDSSFRFHSVERADTQSFHLNVMTEGNDRPVPIQAASQGTLSVLAMFGMIHEFLKLLGDPKTEVAKRRAIVIIDEVDAHLHPSWQHRIAGLLRQCFPNVQFVLSAHSPLLVAGCGPNEVAVMRKNEQRFSVQSIPEPFVGATAKEIYERVFGVKDGDDDTFLAYAEAAARGQDHAERIAQLERKEQRSESEERELEALRREANLGRIAQSVEQQRIAEASAVIDLETECSMLRMRVRELEQRLSESGVEVGETGEGERRMLSLKSRVGQ